MDFATYRRLTEFIYGAVFDQTRWQVFLEELTAATGVRTHIFGFDIPAGISLELTSAGYDPDYIQSYKAYFCGMNAWASGFARGLPGATLASEWMCPKQELIKTEFYQDWLRPQDDIIAGGGAILFKDESRMLAFGGNIRLKDEERLEAAWLDTVGLLTPHLQHAFEVARIFAQQSLELELMRDGTAANQAAVLLIADNGLVLFANRTGERMLEEGSILRLSRAGGVSSVKADVSIVLDRSLATLYRRAPVEPVSCVIKAGPEQTEWVVRIAPFDPAAHDVQHFALLLGYSRLSLLLTVSPVHRSPSDIRATLRAYGLTDAETDICIAIADGRTSGELAQQRALSIHTVRNQLKSAMSKLEIHRQVDLVRMIAALRAKRAELPG